MHVDNFIFILLVLVAMLFQLLTRLATKSSKRTRDDGGRSPSPPGPPRIPRAPAESEEERMRKFLEALGQPTTSKPPAPVAPRPTYQKPVVFPRVPSPMKSPLPPLTTRPPKLPEQISPTGEAKTFRPLATATPATEFQEGPLPLEQLQVARASAEAYSTAAQSIAKAGQRGFDVARLLRSTAGLRDAMILREIFGPPRSLQPFDVIGTI